MSPLAQSFGAIVRINASLLGVVTFGLVAVAIWPDSPEWWGFGVLSVFFGFGAVIALVRALREMVRLFVRDRALASFVASGHAPKSAAITGEDELVRRGMVDA